MRVIYAGSRYAGHAHRQAVADALLEAVICLRAREPHVLVSGAGRGGEQFAEDLAAGWGWQVVRFPADWPRLGKAAGPVRNQAMVAAGGELVVATPATDRPSTGTWDLVRRAAAAGLPVNVRPIHVAADELLDVREVDGGE